MAGKLVTDEDVLSAQSGDADAMWRVVSAHDNLLRGMARHVAPAATSNQVDDLLQEGRAALIARIRSYDSSQSAAQLQTYAHSTVRRAIAEEWIRMSTGLSVDPTTIIRVRQALAQYEGNREAAILSLYARYGIDRGAAFAALEALVGMESLDTPYKSYGSGDNETIGDRIPDPAGDFTETADRRDLAHHLLKQVAPRQSYALAAYHGVGMSPVPDADVAAHLETPAHRVRQLRSDGARNARDYAEQHAIAA